MTGIKGGAGKVITSEREGEGKNRHLGSSNICLFQRPPSLKSWNRQSVSERLKTVCVCVCVKLTGELSKCWDDMLGNSESQVFSMLTLSA